jgi:hypothetical protein
MIIGLCGAQGSGKDTVANILISEYGFVKLTFASTLKDVVAILFSWPRDLLEGLTEESRLWRETIDDFWSEKLSILGFTPRKALQMIGTDLFRIHFNNDIWISIVENKIGAMLKNNPNTNIVISDCRFANEFSLIKQFPDSHIIMILREKNNSINKLVHSSETEWINYNFDAILQNDNSIDDLKSNLKSLLSSKFGK